jgi:ribosome-associated toxin RatA of RatAB toxin-antitoxin module
MKKISRTALLNFSARQMYDVVNNVSAYPEFLPWCGGVEVVKQTDYDMEASIQIAKLGIRQTFTTNNHMQPGERIAMRLKEGPFSHLQGEWSFKPLGEQACKIQFEIEFEVSFGLMQVALGSLFEQIANTLVDSFIQRAQQLYGKS